MQNGLITTKDGRHWFIEPHPDPLSSPISQHHDSSHSSIDESELVPHVVLEVDAKAAKSFASDGMPILYIDVFCSIYCQHHLMYIFRIC